MFLKYAVFAAPCESVSFNPNVSNTFWTILSMLSSGLLALCICIAPKQTRSIALDLNIAGIPRNSPCIFPIIALNFAYVKNIGIRRKKICIFVQTWFNRLYMKAKYPWDEAPYWAGYAAKNSTGFAEWFEEEPMMDEYDWVAPSGRHSGIDRFFQDPDGWENSIQKRPKQEGVCDWKEAPDWAEWATIDENGLLRFHSGKPNYRDGLGEWDSDGNYHGSRNRIAEYVEDWHKFIERRPPSIPDPGFKYPWALAPAWARWAATDSDGAVYWYMQKPFVYQNVKAWITNEHTEKADFLRPDLAKAWANSLEANPAFKQP
jgi:hypothetical protein